jgi:hypothetical protein
MVRSFKAAAPWLASLVFLSAGCGYTTKSLLPENIKTVYIAPVKNVINLAGEISTKERFRTYRPGLEDALTNAVINRFVFDGNLKVVSPEKADVILETKLLEYRRDALRYSNNDDIQEYRVSIVLDAVLYEARGRKTLWHEQTLTGDTTFFLSGSRAVTEDEAVEKAVEDVARRIVENTVGLW